MPKWICALLAVLCAAVPGVAGTGPVSRAVEVANLAAPGEEDGGGTDFAEVLRGKYEKNQAMLTELSKKRSTVRNRLKEEPLFVGAKVTIARSPKYVEKEKAYVLARTELSKLRLSRTERHPDVWAKAAEVEALKKELEELKDDVAVTEKQERNPERDRLKREESNLSAKIAALERERDELIKHIGSAGVATPDLVLPGPESRSGQKGEIREVFGGAAFEQEASIRRKREEIRVKREAAAKLERRLAELRKTPGKVVGAERDVSFRILENMKKEYDKRIAELEAELAKDTAKGELTQPRKSSLSDPKAPTADSEVPDIQDALFDGVRRALARSNYDAALAAAEVVVQSALDDSMRARGLLLAARALGANGLEREDRAARAEAEKRLAEALALGPGLLDELDVGRLRAQLAVFQKSRADCLAALARARREQKGNAGRAGSFFYVGMLHYFLAANPNFAPGERERLEQGAEAIAALGKAVEIEPKRYEFWHWYITALVDAGREKQAQSEALRMLRTADLSPRGVPPGAMAPHVLYASFLEGPEREVYLRARVIERPFDAHLRFEAAASGQRSNPVKCREELEALEKDLASGKLRPPAWSAGVETRLLYRLAALHNNQGDMEKAMAAYDRLIGMSPHYGRVRLQRGLLYRAKALKETDTNRKTLLLLKAKGDFEAQIESNRRGETREAERMLEQTNGELENLQKRGE